MRDLLNHSNTLYLGTACCHDNPGRICNCYDCIRLGFFGGDETYSCIKRLCYYTMNYGSAYVSEIYHFLSASQILENNFNDSTISILSLGCGFGPDYIAMEN